MKLFFEYLRTKTKTIIMCMLFAFIFILSFIFFRLPLLAVIYPIILCTVSALLFLIPDFRSFGKKHTELSKIAGMHMALTADLPKSENITDEDYREIIELLRQEMRHLETAYSEKLSDTTEYYTVWAHQIKTPIASMKLTLQNEDSPASRKLSAELFRIEQYVEMVLAFLRLDSPSSDYLFREYSLDSLIKGSVKKFASDFINKKLSLRYEETALTFITDEKWFSFVLEQLISNAIKYTREGEIHIFADEKKLYIEDTGIGISPEDIPRIFEKGYTGINGRKDKSASGIGLYLCKRICDNLKIDISVTSSENGTSVCLDLEQYDMKKE